MFPSVSRTFNFLARTPLIPQSSGPAAIELHSFAAAGPSRPRAASRTISNMSVRSNRGYSMTTRGYASKPGGKELYSDEAGAVGAGVSVTPPGSFEMFELTFSIRRTMSPTPMLRSIPIQIPSPLPRA